MRVPEKKSERTIYIIRIDKGKRRRKRRQAVPDCVLRQHGKNSRQTIRSQP